MKITETEVEYVAKLANLHIPVGEQTELATQLSQILDYVDQLNTLDLSGIEPTPQMNVSSKTAGRDDVAISRTGSSEAGRTVKLFKVPKVITER
jgi:aspartyl-tRNA(Asn)/glutamyl-tRNA(Gln) amidotransferase subunit C